MLPALQLKNKLKKLWPRKLMIQLALYFSLLLVVSLSIFVWVTMEEQIKFTTKNLQSQAIILANNLASVSGEYLLTHDYRSLEYLLENAIKFPGVSKIQVSNAQGRLISDVFRETGKEAVIKYAQPDLILPVKTEPLVMFINNHMVVWHPVILGELIGWVKITNSLEHIYEAKEIKIKEFAIQGIIIILFAAVLLYLYTKKSVRAIKSYTEFAEDLGRVTGQQVLVSDSSYELEHLGGALNQASNNLYSQHLQIQSTMSEMERLASFPEMNPGVVLSMNKQGEVKYLNPFGNSLIDELNVLQSHMSVLLPDDMKSIIFNCIHQNESVHDISSVYKEREFLWTFSPVTSQELVHGYALEVTQHKRDLEAVQKAKLEKLAAEAANTAKSSFLANMSHEIRTPLTAIVGFSETLLDTSQSMSERIESINTIIRSGHHLMQVINDILDLSKVEANKLEAETIKFSPFEVMSDVYSLIILMAENKGLEFAVEYEYPIPKFINSDMVRLKQIIINLCNNAVKFTAAGSVKIIVSCDVARQEIFFNIIDTGIGLTEEQITKIFNPFTQADVSTTREYGGTGLGLHLSQEFARILGGDIVAQSTLGNGSCFTASIATGDLSAIEMLIAEPKVSLSSSQSIVNAVKAKVSGTVLLAEDNIDNQRLVTMYLKKLGADVIIANNGKEAIEISKAQNVDLILMDMQMPVMNGLEATKILRSTGFTKPIISLTANAMKEDVEACYKAGSDDFVQKPISQQTFMNVITQYLNVIDVSQTSREPITSSVLIDEPEMLDLVVRFISKIPEYINAIELSMNDKNWKAFKQAVHDFKGTSGNYGFEELYKLTMDIEFELAKENYNVLLSHVNSLIEVYKRIQLGLENG
ncbi:MAG: response regulator [Woeseiaceae bacterium]